MSAPASSPLRHRSPQKDPENGPTPKRPDSAAGNAATTAAAAADQPSFFKRHKKLIIFGLVIAGIVVIGAVAGTANSSDSTSSAGSLNTGSGSSSKTPSKRRTPAPTVKTTTKPNPTLAPTLVPAPKRTGMCAFPNNIGKAVWYNAFFEDSFWSNGSSVEGRLAVGKVAWVNQFSVGGALYGKTKYDCPNPDLDAFPEGADYSFVVGGELSINGSTVYNGGLAYVSEMEQGSADIKPWNVQNGCSISPGMGNAIVDFQGTFSQLRAASQAIASLPKALSFTSKTPGTLFFNLNGSIMTEFFNVKERDITAVKKLILKGTPKTYNGTTATIVINVIKDFLNENNTFSYSQWVPVGFTDAVNKYILWNFPGYEYIALRNGDWPGSILAPDASIENTIGNIRGSVYAKSWNTEERSNNIKIYAAPAFQGQVFWNNCPVETAAPTAAETP